VVQRKVPNSYRAMWVVAGEADVRTVVNTARLSAADTFATLLKTVRARWLPAFTSSTSAGGSCAAPDLTGIYEPIDDQLGTP
jgi:transposase